jgi:hypothetical protein
MELAANMLILVLFGLGFIAIWAWLLYKATFIPVWMAHLVLVFTTGLVGNAMYWWYRQ